RRSGVDQVRTEEAVERLTRDRLAALAAGFEPAEIDRGCGAADDAVGAVAERRLVDDRIIDFGLDAARLAPRLREDVVDVHVLPEEDDVVELLPGTEILRA